jgi:hypothetical protein
VKRSGGGRFRPGTLSFKGGVNLWCTILILTFLFPVGRDSYVGHGPGPALYFWELIGIVGFAPMLKVLFPGTVGLVGVIMVQLGRDRGLLALVMLLLLVLGIGVMKVDPTKSMSIFGLWEEAPGHRLLLFLACGCCAVSAAVCNGRRRGTAWGTAGAALIVAYLLTPMPGGMVPLASTLDALWSQSTHLSYQEPGLRLLADVGLFVGATLTLLALQERVTPPHSVRRRAVLAGWLMVGLLPALLFPLVIVYWKGSEDFAQGAVVAREYLVFTGFIGLLPASVSRILDGFYQMGGRMDGGSIV